MTDNSLGDGAVVPETLEQYADRSVAASRKHMLDRLDDDVIGCPSKSHLIFGKMCAMEAVTTAMREMHAGINAHREANPSPSDTVGVEGESERLQEAEQLFRMLIAADAEAAPSGLMDCVDNDGSPYQSASMAGLITHARLWVGSKYLSPSRPSDDAGDR
jgi:hypothetical protein